MDSTAVTLLHPTPEQVAVKPAKQPTLLSPTLDVLMIGGLSMLVFAVAYLFIDKGGSTTQISWAAFYLSFAVNNPHFMASYGLLYWDKRRELLSNRRFFWAAVVVPVLVLGYMGASIVAGSPRYLSYAVSFMYFTVGWHYIKQIYGTIVVTSARRGYYFTAEESRALKWNLYPLWFISFINGNSDVREIMYYGIGYRTYAMPEWSMAASYAALGMSLLGVFWLIGRKWVREGKLPAPSAIVSFAALYVWYLPSLYHAVFWYMIPFFHSLQYMLFVETLKRNQYSAVAAEGTAEPAGRRLAFAKRFLGFNAMIAVTALLAFKLVPEWLDKTVAYDHAVFGAELFMFCFITFINIHHYFIDNVIWRRENPDLKRYL